MAKLAAAIRRRHRRWLRILLIGVALLVLLVVLKGRTVGSAVVALTPPVLPPLSAATDVDWRGDQTWSEAQAQQFHFESQGTHTLPVPLSWFMALEQPLDSPLEVPFLSRGRFAASDYLPRFGFIADKNNGFDSDRLPIGFASTPYQTIPGLAHKDTAIGLTCAACHTGQLIYNDKRYVIEGGPATSDLYRLTLALRAALGQTVLSAKLPVLNGRFRRFARRVLGTEYDDITAGQLAADLDAVVKVLRAQPSGMDVTEGFSRLDALNRIGNQVFAIDPGRFQNYVNPNAPVKYPHIWTSAWFNWVQYDASIMQPMVRNAGEALGVSAGLDFAAPPGHGRYATSIPFDNLDWIEHQLRGQAHPAKEHRFDGLNGPRWPHSFPKIDQALAAQGSHLYDELCSGCHLPALTRDVAEGKRPDDPFWTHFDRISWSAGSEAGDGEIKLTDESVLDLHVIRHNEIGTDPAQGMVLVARQVDTAGTALDRAGSFSPGLGIDTDVCLLAANQKTAVPSAGAVTYGSGSGPHDALVTTPVSDGATQSYALALAAVVQMTIGEWSRNPTGDRTKRLPPGQDRPNCVSGGKGYKARPLNGVWAVAPFLHNGSVPTLYDLLSPVAERPKAFLLGDPTFDPVKVGLVTHTADPRKDDPKGDGYNGQGYFILDTARPGDLNVGHEFTDEKGRQGVVGRALSEDERRAIVEFLKTL